tara:strand:- start:837 stop:1478 length:642 start_codon:yes stop_codon:yes gene_type:complete
MIRKILNLIIPQLFFWAFEILAEKFESKNRLFKGNDLLFKKYISSCRVYGEYGCGKSTIWVSNNTNVQILAVDTSKEWIEIVNQNIKNNNSTNLKHIDLGEIGHWGTPIDYSKNSSFESYTNWIWFQNKKPDLVLIDGRFRVCCFLSSLKFADKGTFLIFDDYIDRPHYHFVEKYLPRSKVFGRQCLFEVPEKQLINLKELDIDIERFRFVLD